MNRAQQVYRIAAVGLMLAGSAAGFWFSTQADPVGTLRKSILVMRPAPLTNLNVAVYVNVADFGAVPDDGLDDRAAIAAAVQQANSMEGPVQIDFSPGTYDLFPVAAPYSMTLGNAGIPLQSCTNLVLDGHGADIVIHRQDVCFVWVYKSENLIIRNFSIDYDPLPFSQGRVVEIDSDGTGFVLELDSGFPVPNDPFFASCDSWGMLKDPAYPGRLKADCPSFFLYTSIQTRSNQLFHVILTTASQISNFEINDPFVINGRSAGIGRYSLSDNITFDHLTAYACPGSLFVGVQTSRLNVLNCRAEMKDNRLIVSGADGVHCQSARIGPWVEGCDFEGLSDDCLNIYGLPVYVLSQDSSTQLTVRVQAPVLPGDRLGFFDPNDGRVILTTTVASISGSNLVLNDSLTETLDIAPTGTAYDARSWKIYDHAYNLDSIGNGFVYRNNHMHDGRRYGVFIKASYGLIENNIFEGLSRTGMTIENAPDWPEGFWAQNLIIQNNRVSECGYGNADPCISIAARKLGGLMPVPMQKNIYLLSNTWNAVSGPAMELSGVSGLMATGNVYTSGTVSGPLVTVQYSEDVQIDDNE